MWVRLGTFSVEAGKTEELRATYNARAVPKVRGFPGNLGCLLLDPGTADDERLWASRADADAYESSGRAQEVVELVRQYFSGPPSLRAYRCERLAGMPTAAGG